MIRNNKNNNSSTRSTRKRAKQQSKATYKAYWEGQRIPHPRPKFIFVSEHHLQQDRRTYGYIVTVCKCKVLDNGSVTIWIKFMELVELFHAEERLQRQQCTHNNSSFNNIYIYIYTRMYMYTFIYNLASFKLTLGCA